MDNMQSNNNLLQNSQEYNIILYRFCSQIYDFLRFDQPVLILFPLFVLVVFTLIVYYVDSRNLEKESATRNVKPRNLKSKFSNTKKLPKNLEKLLYVQQQASSTDECDEANENAEDNEDSSNIVSSDNIDEEQDEDEEQEQDEDEEQENLVSDKVKKVQKLIGKMSIAEIQATLQFCSNYILIPNWYTKKNFEKLNSVKFSNRDWNNFLKDDEEQSTLIANTNNMTKSWFVDNVATKNKKIKYSMSLIDESSDSENEEDDEEDEELDEEDEELEEEEDDDEEDEELDDKPSKTDTNKHIIKHLEKLKYKQLKKIAGATNNKKSKFELIQIILQNYEKLSILQKLNTFK